MRSRLFVATCVLWLLGASHAFASPTDLRLLEAVRKGDEAAVRRLVQQVDLMALDVEGSTALHLAVRLNNLAIAKMLINSGADVHAPDRYGVKPLSLAALNGNAEMVEALLKAGADPAASFRSGETPLMTAARIGAIDAVRILMAHGADVNAREASRAQTSLMWAAAEGHASVIETLVKGGADIHARSSGGFTALLFAVREGRTNAVQALLQLGADVNEILTPPIPQQQSKGANSQGMAGPSALLLAVGNAHFELAALLLEEGADPNFAVQGWTALHLITWIRKPGTGSNNPAPPGSGEMDSLEIVRRLVRHGADVNARVTKRPNPGLTQLNLIGGTPFFLASRTADTELMRLLIELGADPLAPNQDGTTPLMAAAGVGTFYPGEDPGTEAEVLEAVKLALETGGDINAVDNNGETAMHGAAYKHAPSVVRYLSEKGANPDIWNHKNKKGWTPLIIAEGILRAMDIVDSPPTAAAIREVLTVSTPPNGGQPD
jgi:ankyrin repeat protein